MRPCVQDGGAACPSVLLDPHPPAACPVGRKLRLRRPRDLCGGLVTRGPPSRLSPRSLFPGGAGLPSERPVRQEGWGSKAEGARPQLGAAPSRLRGPARHPRGPRAPTSALRGLPARLHGVPPWGLALCVRAAVSEAARAAWPGPSALDSGWLCPALRNQPREGERLPRPCPAGSPHCRLKAFVVFTPSRSDRL